VVTLEQLMRAAPHEDVEPDALTSFACCSTDPSGKPNTAAGFGLGPSRRA
jgi:hypothetical protein